VLTYCLHEEIMTNSFGFTLEKIKNLRCHADRFQTFFWDSKTPSLGIRVTANQSKSFIFQDRLHGKTIRMTIGSLSIWNLGDAQVEARRLKVLTDKGIDPREERAQKKAKAIASRLKGTKGLVIWNEYILARKSNWGDRHLADHLDMVRKGGQKITRGLKKGQLDTKQKGIIHDLLSLPINQITRERVQAWLSKEAKARPARARLALSALKAFMTWAGDQPRYSEFVDPNICDRLSRQLPPKKAKDDCLQKEQLRTWFESVRKISNPVISAYLQGLLLTGARRNELATLKWKDIDFQWHTLVIRDKVEGSRKIPLTPYVEFLLSSLPRNNEYAFSSLTASSGRVTEPRKAHQIAIEESGIAHLSIHGLRRSFGTLSEWVECPVGIVAQIQGHKPSALAEKHYRKRPIDLLRMWHTKIEKFILDEAGIVQPKEDAKRIRLVV
jgi:integrase